MLKPPESQAESPLAHITPVRKQKEIRIGQGVQNKILQDLSKPYGEAGGYYEYIAFKFPAKNLSVVAQRKAVEKSSTDIAMGEGALLSFNAMFYRFGGAKGSQDWVEPDGGLVLEGKQGAKFAYQEGRRLAKFSRVLYAKYGGEAGIERAERLKKEKGPNPYSKYRFIVEGGHDITVSKTGAVKGLEGVEVEEARQTAVGITADGSIICFVSKDVEHTQEQVAKILKGLGCIKAMLFDSATSCTISVKGMPQYHLEQGMKSIPIPVSFAVYEEPKRQEIR